MGKSKRYFLTWKQYDKKLLSEIKKQDLDFYYTILDKYRKLIRLNNLFYIFYKYIAFRDKYYFCTDVFLFKKEKLSLLFLKDEKDSFIFKHIKEIKDREWLDYLGRMRDFYNKRFVDYFIIYKNKNNYGLVFLNKIIWRIDYLKSRIKIYVVKEDKEEDLLFLIYNWIYNKNINNKKKEEIKELLNKLSFMP